MVAPKVCEVCGKLPMIARRKLDRVFEVSCPGGCWSPATSVAREGAVEAWNMAQRAMRERAAGA